MKTTTAEKIFTVAIQLPTAQERAAYVRGAAGEDQALRQQVEALLQAHEEVGGFMPTDPGEAAITIPDRPLSEAEGTTIGRFKLLQKIGEGGMGVIYMAEQTEPVVRKVALKIIKLGMDTRSVIARFEAERQALAMVDHPNIAKVFDAGATEIGRPYLVMELVRGVQSPLTVFVSRFATASITFTPIMKTARTTASTRFKAGSGTSSCAASSGRVTGNRTVSSFIRSWKTSPGNGGGDHERPVGL